MGLDVAWDGYRQSGRYPTPITASTGTHIPFR
jgi:hypothetical protein